MQTASNLTERILRPGHQGANAPAPSTSITTDVSNPARDPALYGDPSGQKIRALTWQGKNSVALRIHPPHNSSSPLYPPINPTHIILTLTPPNRRRT